MVELITFLTIASLFMGAAVLFAEDIEDLPGQITVSGSNETLVLTGNALPVNSSSVKAVARAWVALQVGKGTDAIVLKLYSGAQLGGDLVGLQEWGEGTYSIGQVGEFSIEFIDLLEQAAHAQYSLSVTQKGASGDGQVLSALIDTKVLSG